MIFSLISPIAHGHVNSSFVECTETDTVDVFLTVHSAGRKIECNPIISECTNYIKIREKSFPVSKI